MDIKQSTKQLEQFRYTLYQNLDNRADTIMELLDAMGSMPKASSVVEYSLSPAFRRSYSTIFNSDLSISGSVTDGIDQSSQN